MSTGMSTGMESANGKVVDAESPAQTAELVRSNEGLRNQVAQLTAQNSDLARQLAKALACRQTDLDLRRAALNLMEDAVESRQAEQRENFERRRAEDELRRADRHKDEFLATLAHELRTPLAPIRNSLHIMRLTGCDSAAAEGMRDMIERQVDNMVRLVDDLLDVSRITRGKIELRIESVDVESIVRSAVETAQPLLEAARQQLALSLPDEPLLLDADPLRLGQVLSNLLNNAAKYTDEGGQIWLAARRQDSQVEISVRDNGSGIPGDMLTKIFEPFTQVERTYNRATGGLGIGLALVRHLVELHGGAVEARSEGPGRGSEFVVRLPLAARPADFEFQRAGDKRPGDLGDGSRPDTVAPRRILIVDDNHDAADSLGMLLKLMGADVRTANDGQAALDALRSYRPSVVLLDIGMPGMDGIEVARRMRQEKDGGDVILIALTGWGQTGDRRRTQEAGFNHHFVKPLDLGALQALLATLPAERRQK